MIARGGNEQWRRRNVRSSWWSSALGGRDRGALDARRHAARRLPRADRHRAAPRPARPSHLGEILARRSTLPVRTVTEETPLEPGVDLSSSPPTATWRSPTAHVSVRTDDDERADALGRSALEQRRAGLRRAADRRDPHRHRLGRRGGRARGESGGRHGDHPEPRHRRATPACRSRWRRRRSTSSPTSSTSARSSTTC